MSSPSRLSQSSPGHVAWMPPLVSCTFTGQPSQLHVAKELAPPTHLCQQVLLPAFFAEGVTTRDATPRLKLAHADLTFHFCVIIRTCRPHEERAEPAWELESAMKGRTHCADDFSRKLRPGCSR